MLLYPLYLTLFASAELLGKSILGGHWTRVILVVIFGLPAYSFWAGELYVIRNLPAMCFWAVIIFGGYMDPFLLLFCQR